MSRILILIIACGIVLVLSAVICLAWWKLADRWFPDAARKTGQEITFRIRRRDRGTQTKVIQGAPRRTDEPARRESGPARRDSGQDA